MATTSDSRKRINLDLWKIYGNEIDRRSSFGYWSRKDFDSGYFIINPSIWVQYEYTINLENETIYMLGESGEEFWSFNNLDKLRFNPLVFEENIMYDDIPNE